MSQKRVYVAVPITHGCNRTLAERLIKFLEAEGMNVTSCWVAEEEPKEDLKTPEEVYCRDIAAVSASDAFVAEVSKPSLGIGMELMVAVNKGIPIVCLCENGSSISWMVRGIPSVKIVSYTLDCFDEALESVVDLLDRY